MLEAEEYFELIDEPIDFKPLQLSDYTIAVDEFDSWCCDC